MTIDETRDRYRLYRDPARGWLGGVCAGIAEYLGTSAGLVRLGWVLGLLFFTPAFLLGYLGLVVFLPRRPRDLFADPDDEVARRAAHLGPRGALHEARARMRDVEERIGRMEGAILSEDFALRRKFRDLG